MNGKVTVGAAEKSESVALSDTLAMMTAEPSVEYKIRE